MRKPKSNSAFTLVELVVVVTIVAILGVIGAMSFMGFQKSARESSRISDIGSISKTMELFFTQENYYPDPTSPFEITYLGNRAWTQGTFGVDTQKKVGRISNIPTDPLTGNEYTYSLTNTKREYEIGFLSESFLTQSDTSLLPKNYANAANSYYTNIRGNYNKQILIVREGRTLNILGVPTIITSEVSDTDIGDLIANGTFAIKNSQNLPSSYLGYLPEGEKIRDTSNVFIAGSVFGTGIPVLYEGTIDLLNEENERQKLGNNLLSYYKNSNLTVSNNSAIEAINNIPENLSGDYAVKIIKTLIDKDVEVSCDNYTYFSKIIGNDETNIITGDSFDNMLQGNGGSYFIEGGGGKDIFSLNTVEGISEFITITDYVIGEDSIHLPNNVIESVINFGGYVFVQLDDGDQMFVYGTSSNYDIEYVPKECKL